MKCYPQYKWKDGYIRSTPEYPDQPEYIPDSEMKRIKAKVTHLLATNGMRLANNAQAAAIIDRSISEKEKESEALREERIAELTPALGPNLACYAAELKFAR